MIKQMIVSNIRKLGYDIIKYDGKYPGDFDQLHAEIIEKVRPYTLTSNDRMFALIEGVRYILKNEIQGDILECGVFKGGSMMTVALTLLAEGVTDRALYLFDTFEGMPAPGDRDVDLWGKPGTVEYSKKRISDESSKWMYVSVEDVTSAMKLTGYPMDKVHFVKGMVEDTIPVNAPEKIALLRLDTDWYQSTKHELEHLYERVSSKGIVIVDDYGHFKGAREAVDEYFQEHDFHPFLNRIDYTGRLIIKE